MRDEELRGFERAGAAGDPAARDAYARAMLRMGRADVREYPFWFVRVLDRHRQPIYETWLVRSDPIPTFSAEPVLPTLWSTVNRLVAAAPDAVRGRILRRGNRIAFWKSEAISDGRHVVVHGAPHTYILSATGEPAGRAWTVNWARMKGGILRRNSDASSRSLERAYVTSGSASAKAALLADRLRPGHADPWRVRVAAAFGHAAARAMGLPLLPSSELRWTGNDDRAAAEEGWAFFESGWYGDEIERIDAPDHPTTRRWRSDHDVVVDLRRRFMRADPLAIRAFMHQKMVNPVIYAEVVWPGINRWLHAKGTLLREIDFEEPLTLDADGWPVEENPLMRELVALGRAAETKLLDIMVGLPVSRRR
jgi:hypothetical protein